MFFSLDYLNAWSKFIFIVKECAFLRIFTEFYCSVSYIEIASSLSCFSATLRECPVRFRPPSSPLVIFPSSLNEQLIFLNLKILWEYSFKDKSSSWYPLPAGWLFLSTPSSQVNPGHGPPDPKIPEIAGVSVQRQPHLSALYFLPIRYTISREVILGCLSQSSLLRSQQAPGPK